MFKSIPLFVGLRYFFANSGSQLVSFISGLAVTGLVLGVALLIVVLSVMNGFDRELSTKILSLVSHVQLYSSDGIDDWQAMADRVKQREGVQSATPFTDVNGLLVHRDKVQPLVLHGELLGRGNPVLQSYLDLDAATGVEKPLFLSGKVAGKLGVKRGEKIRMIVPAAADYEGVGRSSITVAFTVVDIFNTNTELDQTLAVTRLSTSSEIGGFGKRVQGLQLEIDDIFAAGQYSYLLQQDLPGVRARDWTYRYGNLYQAIKGSRNLVVLLIFLIVAIAAFNVVSMLVMAVSDKRPAIAILKTLGCDRQGILGIFFVKGSLIGLMGCVIGTGLGVLIASNIGDWAKWLENQLGIQLLNSEVYPVDIVPSHLMWTDVGMVVAIAFVLNMLATLYPAWKAGGVQPADELRYE